MKAIALLLAAAAATTAFSADHAAAQPARPALSVVAAENFYGDVARQLAPDAAVTSILRNPDQDPHLFEASPSVARALARADLVVCNGVGYDPWMAPLLRAATAPGRRVVVVGETVHRVVGDNPHIWYDPANMAAAARAMAAAMIEADPAGRAGIESRLSAFLDSLAPVQARIAALRGRWSGVPVTATEPVFGPMAAALGLSMRNGRFQLAVMNDTEPGASDIAAFERDLRGHAVRVLFFNAQAADPAARRLLAIARASGVAVVGVAETEPPGVTYQGWMSATLDAVERALGGP